MTTEQQAEKWAEDNCEVIRSVHEYNTANDLLRGFLAGAEMKGGMKWVKEFDKPLPNGKELDRRHVKHKGVPHVLIFCDNKWNWYDDRRRHRMVQNNEWSEIEYLDEFPSTSEEEAVADENELWIDVRDIISDDNSGSQPTQNFPLSILKEKYKLVKK